MIKPAVKVWHVPRKALRDPEDEQSVRLGAGAVLQYNSGTPTQRDEKWAKANNRMWHYNHSTVLFAITSEISRDIFLYIFFLNKKIILCVQEVVTNFI